MQAGAHTVNLYFIRLMPTRGYLNREIGVNKMRSRILISLDLKTESHEVEYSILRRRERGRRGG